MKPAIIFDNSEHRVERIRTLYPNAMHVWNAEDACKAIIDTMEQRPMLFLGYIKGESELLISWLMYAKEALAQKLIITIHTSRTPDGETMLQKLRASHFSSVERKILGVDWLKGVSACPTC